MTTIPRGRVFKIEMEIVIQCDAEFDDVEEYIQSELTSSGGYSMDNPLVKGGFEVLEFDMQDTNEFVSFEVKDVVKTGSSTKYRVGKLRFFDRRNGAEIASWKDMETTRREAFAA